jgi:(p)ppGpp synthase/HD superfamily hydrolase
MFDINEVMKAWHLANYAHRNQIILNSEIPYSYHLGGVMLEVLKADYAVDKTRMLQCAILHDVLEDTDVTFHPLVGKFGNRVAEGVLALTKDKNLPTKKEQLLDSLLRIKKQSYEIWVVKMCDRIFNLHQTPPISWSAKKIKSYREDSVLIWEELKEAHPPTAIRLLNAVEYYTF